jgi:hypothetical protein
MFLVCPLSVNPAPVLWRDPEKGELPGRKVGRKWITTKTAVLRWIENTSADDALARAVERGDRDALTKALNKGKVRVRSKGD